MKITRTYQVKVLNKSDLVQLRQQGLTECMGAMYDAMTRAIDGGELKGELSLYRSYRNGDYLWMSPEWACSDDVVICGPVEWEGDEEEVDWEGPE